MNDLGQIHHLAYVVEEIGRRPGACTSSSAPARSSSSTRSRSPTYLRGEDAAFVHASAFGICNEVPVELMVIDRLAPDRAAERFAGDFPRFHHIAYAVPQAVVEPTRAALEASGLPEYLHAHFGDDVDFTYHDGSASLGHDIELHVDSEGLRGFFAMFEGAAAEVGRQHRPAAPGLRLSAQRFAPSATSDPSLRRRG